MITAAVMRANTKARFSAAVDLANHASVSGPIGGERSCHEAQRNQSQQGLCERAQRRCERRKAGHPRDDPVGTCSICQRAVNKLESAIAKRVHNSKRAGEHPPGGRIAILCWQSAFSGDNPISSFFV